MFHYFVTSEELNEAIERSIEGVLIATQQIIDGLEIKVKKLEEKELKREIEKELRRRLEERAGEEKEPFQAIKENKKENDK